jgi:hypothetical protein
LKVTRTHRLGVIAALGCAAVLACASTARATVTIGEVAPGAPALCPNSATDYLQPSVTAGGNLYIAKEAGTISSWSTRAGGAGASWVLKIFRRTSDPDVFQAISHAPSRTLANGLNTFPTALHVESGDMIGVNASGPFNFCTFDVTGDTVLDNPGTLSDGDQASFSDNPDSRLNLSAVLDPSNEFTISISRDRKRGTATLTASTSNPGVVGLSGKGLKSSRAAKSVAVAGDVRFQVAATGKWRRRLVRKGNVKIGVGVTFAPTGGSPHTQTLSLKLKKKRRPAAL